MNSNNQVIIERDMYCPYCESNSAVLISETIKGKKIIGCAPIGLKDGCLLWATGGCWMLISGLSLWDIKEEVTNRLYGFCPHCGNTYPVIKPEVQDETVIDRFNDAKQKATHLLNQAKGFMNNNGQQ